MTIDNFLIQDACQCAAGLFSRECGRLLANEPAEVRHKAAVNAQKLAPQSIRYAGTDDLAASWPDLLSNRPTDGRNFVRKSPSDKS